MARYWLPKLDNNFNPACNNMDLRKNLDANDGFIRNLIDSLDNNEQDNQELRSIPNIWARCMIWQMLVKEFQYSLDNDTIIPISTMTTINEWKGLVAAIVLQNDFNVKINIIPLNLSSTTNPLIKAAKNIIPTKSILNDDSWENASLITCNYKVDLNEKVFPLGITSPTTIVCASASTINEKLAFPWYIVDKTGKARSCFTTPLSYYQEIPQKSLAKLFDWLKYAIESFNKSINDDINLKTPMLFLLNHYKDEVYRFIDQEHRIVLAQEPLGLWNNTSCANGNIDSTIQLLEALYESNNTKRKEFFLDKMHVLRIQKKYNSSGELVWDESCDTDEKFKNFLSKRETRDSRQNLTEIIEIFDNCLVPLTKNGLKLIIDSAIERGLSIRDVVSIDPVTNGTGNPVSYSVKIKIFENNTSKEISCMYCSTDVITIFNLPLTAMWPNVKMEAPEWNNYYMYSIRDSLNKFYFKPNINSEKSSKYNYENRIVEVSKYLQYPKIFSLYENEGHIPSERGYLFTKEPVLINNLARAGNQLEIGIDFGTSSSVIYKAKNSNGTNVNIEPMILDPKLSIISCTSDFKTRNILTRYFMPSNSIMQPFSTIVQVSDEGNCKDTFISSNAYLQKDIRTKIDNSNETPPYGTNLLTSVKWIDDGSTRQIIESFLNQIVLMSYFQARLEGYVSINYSFSHPITTGDVKKYQKLCERIVASIVNDGINPNVSFLSESEAAARHFRNASNNYQMNVVDNFGVIDIGGGSSDIFLYMDNEFKQSSILLGARKIMIDLIKERPTYFVELTNRLFLDEAFSTNFPFPNPIDISVLKDSEKLYLFMETFLTYKHNNNIIGDSLSNIDINENLINLFKQMALFRTILAYQVSSIFFYTGILSRKENSAKGRTLPITDICIAGNGSNIINWIYGAERVSDAINELDKFLSAGAKYDGADANLRIHISKNKKAEAASGLLCDPLLLNNQRINYEDIKNIILTGIEIKISNNNGDSFSISSTENILDDNGQLSEKIKNIFNSDNKVVFDMSEYESFINAFNRLYAGNIKNKSMNKITLTEVNSYTPGDSEIVINKKHLEDNLKNELSQKIHAAINNDSNKQINVTSLFEQAVKTSLERFILPIWRNFQN